MSRAGVTVLETMVALVIVGLVVTASLELYGSSLRSASGAEAWSTVTAYAEEGMELAKLDLRATVARGPEELPGGYRRRVVAHPLANGLSEVRVTVVFPDGGTFELRRLTGGVP